MGKLLYVFFLRGRNLLQLGVVYLQLLEGRGVGKQLLLKVFQGFFKIFNV
jgi:hypothetical protein